MASSFGSLDGWRHLHPSREALPRRECCRVQSVASYPTLRPQRGQIGLDFLCRAYLGLGSTKISHGTRGGRKGIGCEQTFHPTSKPDALFGMVSFLCARPGSWLILVAAASEDCKVSREGHEQERLFRKNDQSVRASPPFSNAHSLLAFQETQARYVRVRHARQNARQGHLLQRRGYALSVRSHSLPFREELNSGRSEGERLLKKEIADRVTAFARGEKLKGAGKDLSLRLIGLRMSNLRDDRKEKKTARNLNKVRSASSRGCCWY